MTQFLGSHPISTNRIRTLITLGFVAAVTIVSYTLISEHQLVRWIYLSYPACMLIAFFHKHPQVKSVAAVASMTIILVGGYVEPLELDTIEEAFILIPLSYIVIFPGSMWPIASGGVLILSYLYELPESEFEEFIEDAIEVVIITVFATIMTYYQQKFREQMLVFRKESLTDFLTSLGNRKAYFDTLKTMESLPSKQSAIIQIDLDNFKDVNESVGHDKGDKLLSMFAQELNQLSSENLSSYRLSGDEFIIICYEENDLTQELQSLENQLKQIAAKTYQINPYSYKLNFCAGIAKLEDSMGNTEILSKNADIAVKKAKSQGKGNIRWYDHELIDETIRQHQIETELAAAIENEQFKLLYQPKVDIKSGKICGAEALIRWHHPQLGVVSPFEFIGIAEKSKLIIPIGRWVIEEATKQAKIWHDEGFNLCVSVNVSTVQFAHDDIYTLVTSSLNTVELSPHLLQLEITETTLMQQPDNIINACNQLRKLGVTVAIDDFGVAYSSLNYLKKLPIDVLKIDKSFIDECVQRHEDHMIVRTIIQLGHNLGKTVIAEGVEDKTQLDLLADEACMHYQGYHFARPLEIDDLSTLLANERIASNQ
ncbi:MAG: putative bifunctional diguanylate cyclase/phosphodiesterase [Vibrio gallaecicus]|uniref:Bifunctional diguanylate cyclase/phosphodiesterase n=1 Tax=Vibrio gallaecicus TaxID=552386 RepID=A0ABV4NFJ1_9VIBR